MAGSCTSMASFKDSESTPTMPPPFSMDARNSDSSSELSNLQPPLVPLPKLQDLEASASIWGNEISGPFLFSLGPLKTTQTSVPDMSSSYTQVDNRIVSPSISAIRESSGPEELDSVPRSYPTMPPVPPLQWLIQAGKNSTRKCRGSGNNGADWEKSNTKTSGSGWTREEEAKSSPPLVPSSVQHSEVQDDRTATRPVQQLPDPTQWARWDTRVETDPQTSTVSSDRAHASSAQDEERSRQQTEEEASTATAVSSADSSKSEFKVAICDYVSHSENYCSTDAKKETASPNSLEWLFSDEHLNAMVDNLIRDTPEEESLGQVWFGQQEGSDRSEPDSTPDPDHLHLPDPYLAFDQNLQDDDTFLDPLLNQNSKTRLEVLFMRAFSIVHSDGRKLQKMESLDQDFLLDTPEDGTLPDASIWDSSEEEIYSFTDRQEGSDRSELDNTSDSDLCYHDPEDRMMEAKRDIAFLRAYNAISDIQISPRLKRTSSGTKQGEPVAKGSEKVQCPKPEASLSVKSSMAKWVTDLPPNDQLMKYNLLAKQQNPDLREYANRCRLIPVNWKHHLVTERKVTFEIACLAPVSPMPEPHTYKVRYYEHRLQATISSALSRPARPVACFVPLSPLEMLQNTVVTVEKPNGISEQIRLKRRGDKLRFSWTFESVGGHTFSVQLYGFCIKGSPLTMHCCQPMTYSPTLTDRSYWEVMKLQGVFPPDRSLHGVCTQPWTGELLLPDRHLRNVYQVPMEVSTSINPAGIDIMNKMLLVELENQDENPLTQPCDVTVDQDRNIYVCDKAGGSVQVFHEDGLQISCYSGLQVPWGVACSYTGTLAVANQEGKLGDLHLLDCDAGQRSIVDFPVHFNPRKPFYLPTGQLFLLDFERGRVLEIITDGIRVTEVKQRYDVSRFGKPTGAAVDAQGNVIITTGRTCKLLIFCIQESSFWPDPVLLDYLEELPLGSSLGGVSVLPSGHLVVVVESTRTTPLSHNLMVVEPHRDRSKPALR